MEMARSHLCLGFPLALAFACAACGGVQRPSAANVEHVRLDGAGRALVEADKLYVCHDRAAHSGGSCNGRPVRLEEWNKHVDAWNRFRDAIAQGYKSMLAAEVAIATWEAGDRRSWNTVEPCAASALMRVKQALEELDQLEEFVLPTPPALTDIKPCPCNCSACADDFYPYQGASMQAPGCAAALGCK